MLDGQSRVADHPFGSEPQRLFRLMEPIDPFEYLRARGVVTIWRAASIDGTRQDVVEFCLPAGWESGHEREKWEALRPLAEAWRGILLLQVKGRHRGHYRPIRKLFADGIVGIHEGRFVQQKPLDAWWWMSAED